MFLTSRKTTRHQHAHAVRSPGRAGRSTIDWVRVEQLYAFARSRAEERLDDAIAADDAEGEAKGRTALRTLESMHDLARRSDDTAFCAITYFRVRAMRDAQHPDFLGEWLGRPLTGVAG